MPAPPTYRGLWYEDQFDGGLILPVSSPYGRGVVSVASGALSIAVAGGTDIDWWYSVDRRCAMPYYDLGQVIPALGQVKTFYLESTFKSIARGGSNTESYITLYQAWNAAYQIMTSDGSWVGLRRIYSGGTTDYGSASGLSLPLRCRFVWDRWAGTLLAQYLAPGGWTTYASTTMQASPVWFGLTQKNGAGQHAITTTWEDFYVAYEASLGTAPPERVSLTDEITSLTLQDVQTNRLEDTGGEEDAFRVPTAGGPPDIRDGVGRGLRVPGGRDLNPDVTSGARPVDTGGLEDALLYQFFLGTSIARTEAGGAEDGYDRQASRLSTLPQYRPTTTDSLGHPHFLAFKPYQAIVYYAYLDPWATPTAGGFTGYAKDGYKYTNGVKDLPAVQAPWSSEASGTDRSNRPDFPDRALIVLATQELVIFDADSFPTRLDVWMRFRLANDGSNYYTVGRGYGSLADAVMLNGVLYVGNYHTGWENGGLHAIDFKATGLTNAFCLVRNDGQWIGASGRTIAQRNTNGTWASSGSNRINSTRANQIAVWRDPVTGVDWVAVSGENAGPSVVKLVGNSAQTYYYPSGNYQDSGGIYYYRVACIDRNGWLWYSVRNRVYRNLTDWREGLITQDTAEQYQGRFPYVSLPSSVAYVTSLVDLDRYIAAGTGEGIYLIDKTTMRSWKAYSVVGGRGRGKAEGLDGAGAILGGDKATLRRLQTFRSPFSTYLETCTQAGGGGSTVIRFWDEMAFKTLWDTLYEDGAYFARTLVV